MTLYSCYSTLYVYCILYKPLAAKSMPPIAMKTSILIPLLDNDYHF